MAIFVPIVLLIVIPALIYTIVQVLRFNRKLQSVTNELEKSGREQKIMISSYLNEARSMGLYREAMTNVEKSEVRELFKKLYADEERHLATLSEALA